MGMEVDGGRGTGYTKGGIYAGRRNRYVVYNQSFIDYL